MNLKKLVLIGAIALVVIGCVIAAGCTSTPTTQAVNDPIVGTYGLDTAQISKKANETTYPSTGYEKQLIDLGVGLNSKILLNYFDVKLTINNDGTGKIVTKQSSSSPASEGKLTWKKNGDGTYEIAYVDSVTITYKFNPVTETLSDEGDILIMKKIQA